jgi:peptidoglycan-associated lipoprotein
MKMRVLLAGLVLSFLVVGCSDKAQEVKPDTKKEKKEVAKTQPKKDGVAADEKVNAINGGVDEENANSNSNASDTVANVSDVKIYFDFDKFNIREDMKENIEIASEKVEKLPNGTVIKIEGNCDEWGTDEYNYALGLKRAKSVKDALKANGVEGKKLKLISYGESNPACSGHNDECWAKNRRVEFKVLQ